MTKTIADSALEILVTIENQQSPECVIDFTDAKVMQKLDNYISQMASTDKDAAQTARLASTIKNFIMNELDDGIKVMRVPSDDIIRAAFSDDKLAAYNTPDSQRFDPKQGLVSPGVIDHVLLNHVLTPVIGPSSAKPNQRF